MAEVALDKEKERLAKLWDAYEEQEREFNLALKKIASLEGKVTESTKIGNTLKKVTEGRDREIRELEIKTTALTEENELFRPELERLENLYRGEKERYAKLFAITEELEEELDNARVELEMRDKWFQKYFGQLESFNMAMKERAIMIRESKFTSPEKVKPVRFEKIELDSEDKAEGAKKKVKFESLGPDEDESGDDDKKADTSDSDSGTTDKNNLTELELVDDEIAGKLKDAGIKDISELAEMSTPELSKIDGISPTTARKLIKAAKDFS